MGDNDEDDDDNSNELPSNLGWVSSADYEELKTSSDDYIQRMEQQNAKVESIQSWLPGEDDDENKLLHKMIAREMEILDQLTSELEIVQYYLRSMMTTVPDRRNKRGGSPSMTDSGHSSKKSKSTVCDPGQASPEDPDLSTIISSKLKQIEENSDVINGVKDVDTNRVTRIPPVVIKVPLDFTQFISALKQEVTENLTAKTAGPNLNLYVNSADEHRLLTNYLDSNQVRYYYNPPKEYKIRKYVIKGLPISTEKGLISKELTDRGFTIKQVNQLRRKDKSFFPIFQIHVASDETSNKIEDLTDFLGVIVTVEKYINRKGIPQCYNCQQFNHSSENCTMLTACVYCAGEHRKNCPNKNSPPKCANCFEAHTANFKGCIKYPKSNNTFKSNKLIEGLTYSQVTQSKQPPRSEDIPKVPDVIEDRLTQFDRIECLV